MNYLQPYENTMELTFVAFPEFSVLFFKYVF